MQSFNVIQTGPARSLEVGDLVATESAGTIISGKITGIVYQGWQLNDEQMDYMIEHKLSIPEDEYTPLGGDEMFLIFGNFKGRPNHMYIEFDKAFAVFPQGK